MEGRQRPADRRRRRRPASGPTASGWADDEVVQSTDGRGRPGVPVGRGRRRSSAPLYRTRGLVKQLTRFHLPDSEAAPWRSRPDFARVPYDPAVPPQPATIPLRPSRIQARSSAPAATNALAVSALATVVAFQVYDLTHDPLALGWLGLVEAIPALSLVLFGGHLADRRERRTIVVVTSAAVTALRRRAGRPARHGGVDARRRSSRSSSSTGIASGFERPALTALEAQVVPREEAARGVSILSSVEPGGLDPRTGRRRDRDRGHRRRRRPTASIAVLLAVSTACLMTIGRKPMPAAGRRRAVRPEPARRDPLRPPDAGPHRLDGARPLRGLLRRGDRAAADLRDRHPARRLGRARRAADRAVDRRAARDARRHPPAAEPARGPDAARLRRRVRGEHDRLRRVDDLRRLARRAVLLAASPTASA